MTREELIERIGCLEPIEPLYYIDSDETDGHPPHIHSFCREHAVKVARVESIATGFSMFIAAGWTQDDRAERCEWYGCDVALNAGGLTDYGIDNSLGLTETDPERCHVYPAELELSAHAMASGDPRWQLWEHHARKLLRRRR